EVASTMRRQVQAIDPTLAAGRTEPMAALLSDSVAEPRFAMLLIGSFAGHGLALIACGIPIGILLSWFTSRSAAALLLNVRTSDPLVLAGVAALLTLTSLAAMLGPARRAAG